MDNSSDNQPKTSFHPRLNDNGKPILIQKPSEPTGTETWSDPMAIATFLPGGAVPDELNGIPFEPWVGLDDDMDWEELSDESDFDEPALKLDKPAKVSSSVIIREPDGRFWIVHPTNGFGGYKATFPKGRAEGLSLQANAIKEAGKSLALRCA